MHMHMLMPMLMLLWGTVSASRPSFPCPFAVMVARTVHIHDGERNEAEMETGDFFCLRHRGLSL